MPDGVILYFAGSHNGGEVRFGTDGYLYAAIGGCDYAGDSGYWKYPVTSKKMSTVPGPST